MKHLVVITGLLLSTMLTACGTPLYVGVDVLPQRHGVFSSGTATQEVYYHR